MSPNKPRPLNHNIKVDDEVWAALQAMARPFVDSNPNDVLRNALLKSSDGPAFPVVAPPRSDRRPGALITALNKGDLVEGDLLVCEQPRRSRTFKARVTSDGWIALEAPQEGEFDKPSPALGHCTGGQINGWGNWIVSRTKLQLQQYRY